jgi:hypothetical protein
VTAELHITGKVAQFGRGIMGDVSKKLMDQFSANLNTMLDDDVPIGGTGDTAGDAAEPATEPATTSGDDTGGQDRPTVRRIDGPAAEPIDVAGLAGPAVLKRAAPVALVIVVLLLLLRRLR